MNNIVSPAHRFLTQMESSQEIYTRYRASGRKYRDACDLKDCNEKIRILLVTFRKDLPVPLQSIATVLTCHYDEWLNRWYEHNKTHEFKEDSVFAFDNPHHFPKEAARILTEYYRCQCLNILFFGKANDRYASYAADYLRQIFPNLTVAFGERGEQFPEDLTWWQGDYIFSYLSPWIIPQGLLKRAAKGAINWHPGPPEFPGIGCTNFAIYNQEAEFGITCHYMAARVDTGSIIEVRRFPILAGDTVYSVTQKCYARILCSFLSVIEKIVRNEALPDARLHWTRQPYTRRELNALCEITPDMPMDEVFRRIDATTYDKPWAYTEIHGIRFYLK